MHPEEYLSFLRRSVNHDLLMAADYAQDHPDSPGVQKAFAVIRRILGFQARSDSLRKDLVDRITRLLFGESKNDRRFLLGIIDRLIRSVNHPSSKTDFEIIAFEGWKMSKVNEYINDYLYKALRKHEQNIYQLISRR